MMNPNICIYKITNLVNNKIYIGQTITGINSRWKGHLYKVAVNFFIMLYLSMGRKILKLKL